MKCKNNTSNLWTSQAPENSRHDSWSSQSLCICKPIESYNLVDIRRGALSDLNFDIYCKLTSPHAFPWQFSSMLLIVVEASQVFRTRYNFSTYYFYKISRLWQVSKFKRILKNEMKQTMESPSGQKYPIKSASSQSLCICKPIDPII
jgi:hypothetical protein